MHVCMYMCMYVYVCVCVCVCMSMYICMHICIYVYMCVCVYVYMSQEYTICDHGVLGVSTLTTQVLLQQPPLPDRALCLPTFCHLL